MPGSYAGLGEADAGRRGDQPWLIVYHGIAVGVASQLAISVVSPAVEVAVRSEAQGMRGSSADLGEADAGRRGDQAWRALFFFRCSQFVIVVSPPVEVAVRGYGLGPVFFCWDDVAEAYLRRGGRGQSDLGASFGWPLYGGEVP